MSKEPFWRRKRLEEMTDAEWESLCDGCGRCCLVRLVDEESGESGETNIACKMLDLKSCRCADYANRKQHVPDCMKLTPALARSENWLPETCAYRLLATGRDLPDWHPLRTGGDRAPMRRALIPVTGFAVSERDVEVEDESELWDYVYRELP